MCDVIYAHKSHISGVVSESTSQKLTAAAAATRYLIMQSMLMHVITETMLTTMMI